MSAHERRMAHMRERMAKLEASALAEKDWFLQGEAQAGAYLRSCFAALLLPYTPPSLYLSFLIIPFTILLPLMNRKHALLLVKCPCFYP